MNLLYYAPNELDENGSKIYDIVGYNEDYFKHTIRGDKDTIDMIRQACSPGKSGIIIGHSFWPMSNSAFTIQAEALILKPYANEEDESMSRRIGEYVNPQTGETDWLEPDTVELIVLQPAMVTRVGETTQTPIYFKLNNDEDNKAITITARYTVSGTMYQSNPVPMEEEEFANQFSQQIYSDKALDEAAIVKDSKDVAMRDLSRRLMDNNVLIGGIKLSGLGFVIVDGDKVMTIEDFEFQYAVENGKGVKTIMLKGCVGNASLQNLTNHEICFYNETHMVECIRPVVSNMVEGRLKDYVVIVDDIKVTTVSSMPDHEKFGRVDANNEELLNRFINSRKAMLNDSLDNSEANIEDRLGDFL